jgi:hypothetical protein
MELALFTLAEASGSTRWANSSTLEATMNQRTGSLVAAILTIATVPATARWLNVPTKGIPRTKDGKQAGAKWARGLLKRMSIALALTVACLQAQWINQPTARISRTQDGKPNLAAPTPKMPDGKPDLSGLWTLRQSAGGLSQLKPGQIQPWAEALVKQRQEDLLKDSPITQCLPSWGLGGLTKIIQTPGLIVMLREALTYRQIFLDGRALPKDPNPAWMGYSVGHWEGDTLVVESSGYNKRTWLEGVYPHTEDLRVTERFRRRDFGHRDVDVTFRDLAIYEKPWMVKVDGLFTADTELIEAVCAENEKDRVHLVGKKSDDAKDAVQLAPEILSKYAGTYEFHAKELGMPGPDVFPLKIAVEDGVLLLSFGDGPKEPMTALSENTFTGPDGPIEFGKDDSGEVSHRPLRLNRGEFRGNRKRESK